MSQRTIATRLAQQTRDNAQREMLRAETARRAGNVQASEDHVRKARESERACERFEAEAVAGN